MLHATLPAAPSTPWLIRQQLNAWLTALRWPASALEDVVFAISEAVSNASEHAYPTGTLQPVVEISAVIETVAHHARSNAKRPADSSGSKHDQHLDDQDEQRTGRRLRIRVRDHGTWRPVPPEPGHRGRGLQMMMALMNEVVIHHGDADGQPGTEVILVSPTVDLEPPT